MPKLVTDDYKPKETSRVQELVDKPKIVPVDYHSAIVDNRVDRLDTLLQYVEGSNVEVVYFRQRLGKDDSVTDFSVDISAPHQQYERIDGFEIVMQGGLSVSNSGTDTRTTEIIGEALVRQPIIPNVSDLMLMDFGRGTLGLFKVISSRRMSHRKNTLYEIQFSLLFEITDQINDKRMINLNQKVVEVFKYSIDYLKAGSNPLITPYHATKLEDFVGEYKRLRTLWFRKFYSRFHETCPLPNQRYVMYDGFFMKAIARWFSSRDVPELIYFKIFDDNQFPLLKNPSIWDVISHQDLHLMKDSFDEVVPVTTKAFTSIPQFASIRYSGFGAVIMPTQFDYTNEIYLDKEKIIGKALPVNTSVNKAYAYTYQGIPLINQVILNKSYVFSKDFYHDAPDGQSHLELQLRKYLEDNTLDIDVIEALIEDIDNWAELEQYYYIPVLMILINYCTRRMNV